MHLHYLLTFKPMLKSMKYDLMIALPALMMASVIGAFAVAHS
jgi:hypothetical protein